MLRLNKTFNSFNVIGDQWTPYTNTKKERKNGPSPLFFCLICVVCRHSLGDLRRVQLPVGVGVEGRRG